MGSLDSEYQNFDDFDEYIKNVTDFCGQCNDIKKIREVFLRAKRENDSKLFTTSFWAKKQYKNHEQEMSGKITGSIVKSATLDFESLLHLVMNSFEVLGSLSDPNHIIVYKENNYISVNFQLRDWQFKISTLTEEEVQEMYEGLQTVLNSLKGKRR